KGPSNQDFGYMMWEGFKYFGGGTGTPWSSTTWGPIPDNGAGTGPAARDYPSNAAAGSAYSAGADSNYAYSSSSTNNNGANPPVKYNPPPHTTACAATY